MSGLADLLAPPTRERLGNALLSWLPERRWFQGKARTLRAARVADAVLVRDRLLDVFCDVDYTDGGTERYQVPLTLAGEQDAPTRVEVDGITLVDALADEDCCRILAELVTEEVRYETASGATIVGRPVTGTAPTTEDRPRIMRAEQSNSSVVFGNRHILKLLRRLEAGVHPDVELTRGLTEAGFGHVPAQHGSCEFRPQGQEATALAVLADFVAGGREGWDLARHEAADIAGGAPAARDGMLAVVADLGEAVAGMHATLARRFSSRPADHQDVAAWARGIEEQTDRVVALAVEQAPEAAGEVLARLPALRAAADDIRRLSVGGPLMRIHGDLHLGQVLLDAEGTWQLLDFEGEPARPLAERREPSSPLRDVAGMLRSFDYAAAAGSLDRDRGVHPLADELAEWRDELRRRFLAAYLGDAGDLLPEPEVTEILLAAFELDKAVYELGYELANRPSWVPIPAGGIVRVLTARDAGRTAKTTWNDPPSESSALESAVTSTASNWKANPDDVAALVSGAHQNPHRILGLHEVDSGAVVRTYRPEAERVEVVVKGAEPVPGERTADAGIFEIRLDEPVPAKDYRLRVTYPDGNSFDLFDPYAFWPTVGDIDLHLAGEGRHEELWTRMGARLTTVDGVNGTAFSVWAPNAKGVRVVGDFNRWDGRLHPMRSLGGGIWELFVPEVGEGAHYKFEIVTADGRLMLRADPFANATEEPPNTASVVFSSQYTWNDDEWLAARARSNHVREPLSVYEVHLGSWRRPDGGNMNYRDIAHQLGDHVSNLGFTHVELMPVSEHPFGGSWGYQVTGYFAPTSRFGSPDDFRYMVDHLHSRGIGIIVDWVPAHFPKDEFALARFDGTALYEHADPRQGEHPDWGTLVFNFGRNEVRNFLLASALYWVEELHIDGLRVDAVASMLYLDYSRKEGEWVPNMYGGNENLEAIDFLKEMNAVVYGRNPGVMTIAEESTAWPGVSRPVHLGGLGFGFKWNMGWMHDTLAYFSRDPIHRRHHHHELTFGLLYAWSENYMLPLSHDEVVHGKRSLIDKMPGDRWQKFANLRALYGYMWAHPGKQLLFMGGEFGQWREWTEERELDWYLLGEGDHAGLQRLVGDLNAVYREQSPLWQRDTEPEGFHWIDANNADESVLSFARYDAEGRPLVCLANLTPVPRGDVRVGIPHAGQWRELVNTDADIYGGSGVGNYGLVRAEDVPWHDMEASASLTLPPLATVWLVPS